MENFNTKYNSTKIYNDSEKSDYEDKSLLSPLPKVSLPIITTPAKNKANTILLEINLVCTIVDNNFNSFCLSYIVSKQICVIIYNKPIIKVKEKLDEVYVNLWGLYYTTSLIGKSYTVILLDIKTRKTQVIQLHSKDKFVNAFQIQLSKVKNKYNRLIKVFCANRREEFKSAKFKDITIKYIAPYIYEQNRLVIRGFKMIIIVKDLLLVDNGFFLKFWGETIDTINYL